VHVHQTNPLLERRLSMLKHVCLVHILVGRGETRRGRERGMAGLNKGTFLIEYRAMLNIHIRYTDCQCDKASLSVDAGLMQVWSMTATRIEDDRLVTIKAPRALAPQPLIFYLGT